MILFKGNLFKLEPLKKKVISIFNGSTTVKDARSAVSLQNSWTEGFKKIVCSEDDPQHVGVSFFCCDAAGKCAEAKL